MIAKPQSPQSSTSSTRIPAALGPKDVQMMAQAKALEASFLAEMLSFTGLGAVSEEFGGGVGEEQFSSFLRQEQAKMLVARGGIGLAEQIFESMKGRGT